jgi:hypothetical protein
MDELVIRNKINEEIKERGGILLDNPELDKRYIDTIENFEERGQAACDLIASQLPSIRQIQFKVIDNFKIGAFATGFNGIYFIGIHRGAISSLLILFDRILADSSHFDYLGDVSLCPDNLPHIPHIGLNYEYAVDFVPVFDPPKCPIRFHYARHFCRLCVDLLTAHELTHIIHGHCDYSFSRYQENFVADIINNNMVAEDDLLIKKTLEMDADSNATEILLSSELDRCIGLNRLPAKYLKWLYDRPGMVLMQHAHVSSILFRLFGDDRLSDKSFIQSPYPSPRLRSVISLLRTRRIAQFKTINEQMKFDLDEFGLPIVMQAGFKTMEEIYLSITGKDRTDESIDDAWGTIGQNQLNILVKYWNTTLKNELQPFAHIKLFDYQLFNTSSSVI